MMARQHTTSMVITVTEILLLFLASTAGDLESTFGRCCAFGANWAREDRKCHTFPAPVASISSEHQSVCITAASICCVRFYRDEECQKGKQAAQRGQECLTNQNEGGEFYKDCCDGCKLGLVSGSMGMGCNMRFKFGFPWDNAYLQCCAQASPGNAVNPDHTLQLPTHGGNEGLDSSTLYPGVSQSTGIISESEDLCARFAGKLCAHVCVPTPGSYRCQCRAGFTLSIDGKTCIQDPVTDRCELNNPCAHICQDTGVSIECSCRPGFSLARDQRSCEDVDECTSGLHKCVAREQVCYNQVGSYVCINADGSLSPGSIPHQAISVSSSRGLATGGRRTGSPSLGLIGGDGTIGAQGFPSADLGYLDATSQGRCPPGYNYNLETRVCDDVDECEVISGLCGQAALCQNTIGSYTCTHLHAADCPPGFAFDLNLQSCLDIDECLDRADNCNRTSHFCLNTQGGFTCQEKRGLTDCIAGYKYSPQQQTCVDVDECEENLHGCAPQEETCRNTAGAYECDVACDEGFQFSLALRTCVDQDECADLPCDSGWQCHNTAGSYTCHELPRSFCPAGYKPSNSTSTGCEDVDECVEDLHTCHSLNEICINEIGKYRCEGISSITEVDLERHVYEILPRATFQTPVQECTEGYGFDLKSSECLDIDECKTGLHNCSASTERCINTLGGFMCRPRRRCSAGYALDTETGECKDVDECLAGVASCLPGQICINTEGAFECRVECQDGFVYDPLDAAICVDIDECASSPCGIGMQCVNTEGSYNCVDQESSTMTTPSATVTSSSRTPRACPHGYGRNPNSLECEDYDECRERVCEEEQICHNTHGSYQCHWLPCEDGYERDDVTHVCLDVDECHEGQHNCEEGLEVCENTPGSYTCGPRACTRGYINDPTNPTLCIDVNECESRPCGPEEQCINSHGSYRCRRLVPCRSGFVRNRDSKKCEDINECLEENPCAEDEQCINTRGSYQCRSQDCSDGYVRNANGQCRDIDECDTGEHTCQITKEKCINTLGSYRCSTLPDCPRGFTRSPESLRCVDVDECAEGTHDCQGGERCFNQYGHYSCKGSETTCQRGYSYNSSDRRCKDIDECAERTDTCLRSSQSCVNSVGSFRCVDREPTCDFGYTYDEERQTCIDFDECKEGLDDCEEGQYCVNTLGSYQCHTQGAVTQECHPGFTFNSTARICIDIDECAEGNHGCSLSDDCVNRRGDYVCQPKHDDDDDGDDDDDDDDEDNEVHASVEDSRHNDRENSQIKGSASGSSKRGRCESGYRFNRRRGKCIDINECEDGLDICDRQTEKCVNTLGDYWCAAATNPDNTTSTPFTAPPPPTLAPQPQPQPPQCPSGTSYNAIFRSCQDIDECATSPCGEHERCENSQGSYQCQCQDGFHRDDLTQQCQDVNECQLGLYTCEASQRCDNSIGSYRCTRTVGCGTGYTLNHNTGECDDDDECLLGIDDCDQLGPKYQCVNSKGSFRCEKKRCPPTEILTDDGTCVNLTCNKGYKPVNKQCIDVNECAEGTPCRRNEQCINTIGSYSCRPLLNCGAGYEMNNQGSQCIDIDECSKGTHQCTGIQECSNRQGGYICQCPSGYRLNNLRQCQDVNECEQYFGNICSSNAVCENTQGSFRCNCKHGFKQAENGRTCIDVDECEELPGICHHTCSNIWGSYRCSCRGGYNLARDNRTCTDIDECEEYKGRGRLCIGFCVNTPGSFKCSCPEGYRLAVDGRTCKDIDECETQAVCRGENIHCVNTRGSYRCNTVNCPANYVRDTQHKNRCKRLSLYCREGDEECRRKPLSYSYNFLPLVSNLALPSSGQVDLFTMRGPLWASTTVQFELELESARAPVGVEAATREFFHLKRTSFNQAVISLAKPITGPQEVKLSLNMQLYHQGVYGGSAVAELLIYVSEYEF